MVAQATGSDPTSWLTYLGPFVPFGGLATWIIVAQSREISRLRQRNDDLSDRAVAKAAEATPLLTQATQLLAETARELERRDR